MFHARSALVGMLLLSLILFVPLITGCAVPSSVSTTISNMTPAQRVTASVNAGEAAGVLYINLEKPTQERAAAIKIVVDLVAANLKSYKDGGFINAASGINLAIDKALPGDDKAIARLDGKKLAQTLLTQLDILFDKHPEWKTSGVDVASLVVGFCTGVSNQLDLYVIK